MLEILAQKIQLWKGKFNKNIYIIEIDLVFSAIEIAEIQLFIHQSQSYCCDVETFSLEDIIHVEL
jgi:hypothetical protein